MTVGVIVPHIDVCTITTLDSNRLDLNNGSATKYIIEHHPAGPVLDLSHNMETLYQIVIQVQL